MAMGVILNLAAFSAVFVMCAAQVEDLLIPKQAAQRSGAQDQNSAETGFGGGGGGGIENSKYFQEIYMLQSGPKQIEFGHVCESPHDWEQRYEKKDFDANRHQGKVDPNFYPTNFLYLHFQGHCYQHLPEHDKYEFGYRRGNDHHVRERYEKAVPHEGHFKTKVRWADHKGGHGEHYWDYNHAGHGGDGDGEGSDPVPIYTDSQNANSNTQPQYYRKGESDQEASRRQYNQEPVLSSPPAPRDVDSDDRAGFVKSFEDEIGGIQSFEIHREGVKQKRNPTPVRKPVESNMPKEARPEIKRAATPQLFFDLETGRVVDEGTGKTYLLQPIEN